jgi:hypothetical protein
MTSSGILRRVALVRTDVLDDLSASVPQERLFLQEPHGVTSQKTPFSLFFSQSLPLLVRMDLSEFGQLPTLQNVHTDLLLFFMLHKYAFLFRISSQEKHHHDMKAVYTGVFVCNHS